MADPPIGFYGIGRIGQLKEKTPQGTLTGNPTGWLGMAGNGKAYKILAYLTTSMLSQKIQSFSKSIT
jgi:hypothetical protein